MKLNIAVLALAGLTAIHPAWLELAGIDPDHANGSLELMLSVACLLIVIAAALGLVAVRRRR